MKRVLLPIICLLPLSSLVGSAQEAKQTGANADEATHQELRALKVALVDAFNKKDIDKLVEHLHPDVTATWQNGEVTKGPKGVRDYYNRMLVGEKSVVEKIEAAPEVTDIALLFGSPHITATAYGKLNDKYKLRDGTEFNMNSLFSATMVKKDGKWLIVNYHGSTNVFDNEVLKLYVTKSMWWTGGIAGGVALILGLLVGRMLGGKKAA